MKGISSRERVVIALSHQEPDKVPIDIGEGRQTSIYVQPYLKTMQALGFGAPEIVASPRGVVDRFDERFLQKLDIDFRRIAVRGVPQDQVAESDGTFSDEWGIRWKKVGYFVSPVHHPLKDATVDDLKRYRWPDPNDERRFKGVREEAEFKWKNTGYAIVAQQPNHTYGVLTEAIYLRGMENFFMDLIINKEFASALMAYVTDYHVRLYENYLDAVGEFVNVVHTSDDLGAQAGPYMSLDMYREIIKPHERRFMSAIKNKTEAKILHHSDGAITSFIDDLIEIGVDILNPVQPSPEMDPPSLKKAFGGRISFHGGIDQHRALTGGTSDDVRAEVELRIRQLAPGGGYILAAAQTVMPEVPAGNIICMFETARKKGRYPIG